MRRQEAEKFDLRNLTGEARECLETLDSNSLVEFLLDYDADDFDTISEDAVGTPVVGDTRKMRRIAGAC